MRKGLGLLSRLVELIAGLINRSGFKHNADVGMIPESRVTSQPDEEFLRYDTEDLILPLP